jgi:hypothetical protein
MSKPLRDFKLVELTLVISIPTYYDALSAIDYVVINDEAQLLGWSEQPLTVTPTETAATNES